MMFCMNLCGNFLINIKRFIWVKGKPYTDITIPAKVQNYITVGKVLPDGCVDGLNKELLPMFR